MRDDPYWASRKNSLELIELSSINKVSLVEVLLESSTQYINKVSLVEVLYDNMQ